MRNPYLAQLGPDKGNFVQENRYLKGIIMIVSARLVGHQQTTYSILMISVALSFIELMFYSYPVGTFSLR